MSKVAYTYLVWSSPKSISGFVKNIGVVGSLIEKVDKQRAGKAWLSKIQIINNSNIMCSMCHIEKHSIMNERFCV